MFEDNLDQSSEVYIRDSQGMLRKSASVKRWESIGVGKSGDGFGVYALDDIKDNQTVEECPCLEIPIEDVKGSIMMDILYKYSDDIYVLAMGNGAVYNHRNQPNARWEYNSDKKLLTIAATRTIKSGEEIFINYGREYFSSRNINMKK